MSGDGDEHSNGHPVARASEITRLDMRIDEQARISAKEIGRVLDWWTKTDSTATRLDRNVDGMREDVNNLGHRVHRLEETLKSRLGSLESAVSQLGNGVAKMTALLEKLLPLVPGGES